MHTTDTGT